MLKFVSEKSKLKSFVSVLRRSPVLVRPIFIITFSLLLLHCFFRFLHFVLQPHVFLFKLLNSLLALLILLLEISEL